MKQLHAIMIAVAIGIALMSSSSLGIWAWNRNKSSPYGAPLGDSSSSASSSTPATSSENEQDDEPEVKPKSVPKPQDEIFTVTACEADALKMSCKDGMSISDGTIRYGRWDIGDRKCGIVPWFELIRQKVREKSFKMSETPALKQTCVGKQNCEFAPNSYNTAMGDTFPMVPKQLEARYTCSAAK
jgi:hypothetical protein